MKYVQNAVDIIIPTYKPDEKFIRLIELLEKQEYPVRNIYVVNTEKKYWDDCETKTGISSRYSNLQVSHIGASMFDHGGTRKRAAQLSDAEFLVFMTQDAIPYDEKLIGELIATLKSDAKIAATYARQLPSDGASVTEQYVRTFNYPEQSRVKDAGDLDELGIKTYFCSNVCAAYRHDIYDDLGGFVSHTIFNEDMIYAATAIKEGYRIGYTATGKVLHSHNYSPIQQLHRNFDLAVSQAEHPEVFEGIKSEGEGFKLVINMYRYLVSIHKVYLMPGFVVNCGFRYLGFKLGHNYKKLPKSLIMWMTSNKAYWKD